MQVEKILLRQPRRFRVWPRTLERDATPLVERNCIQVVVRLCRMEWHSIDSSVSRSDDQRYHCSVFRPDRQNDDPTCSIYEKGEKSTERPLLCLDSDVATDGGRGCQQSGLRDAVRAF